MADQKRQGNQPERQGQNPGTGSERNNDPSRREEQGQSGAGRQGQQGNPERGSQQTNPERGSQRTGTDSETRNKPEGDVEGLGTQSRR
jgi:hypothetical protein